MSVSLPLSSKTESATGAGARRLLIDPGSLVLSSDGYSNADSLQEPLYGVPCLLHNDGAVGTVLVSSLTCGHDVYTQDDDIPEEIQQRMRALWRHPHRCITPPIGLSACQASSGLNCMLFVEQLRSTSSLQSMILSQMQSPERTLYSTKQALDWLVQLASALAHLHTLAPEMPHGRLSTSTIAVTSAADISLGRCVTAAAASCDHSPSSKRVHVMSCSSLPPLEPLGEMVVPQAFRPHRASPLEWRSFSSMPARRTGAGISAAFSPSPDSSLPGQRLSLSEASELSGGSQGDRHGADQSQHSTPVLHPWGGTDCASAWDPTVSACLQRLSLTDARRDGSKHGSAVAVSRAQVAGVGTVFKVSLPSASTAQSSRSSLHDAAEAAVWARTECGSETKQHGGALFARAKLGSGAQSHSAPLLNLDSCSSAEGASPVMESVTLSRSSGPPGQLDAADTVHVLLHNAMMWDPSSHPGAAPLPQPVGRRADSVPSVMHMSSGPGPAGSSFMRVASWQAVDTSLVTPFRDVQRASDDGTSAVCRSPGGSNPAKRTRSGLSQRLPSLVELPGAEARCAAQDIDVELDCTSARDSLDGMIQAHTAASLPGRGAAPLTDFAAARPVQGGLSRFSSSSPGVGPSLHDAGPDSAEEPAMPPGLMISTALARLQYAAPALARVRSTVLRAATGRLTSEAQHAGQPVESSTDSVKAGACVSSGRTSEEQKQRGSLSVMQLLQTSKDNDRERWRSRLLNRKASCSGLLRTSNAAIATHIGRWHDDLPYLAPEVLEGGEASRAADCFAFGVITYEVIKRELVAADIAMQADLNDLTDEDALRWHVARIVDGERPRVPVSWPTEVREVIQLCWQDNPFDRPSLASVHASLVQYQSTNPQ